MARRFAAAPGGDKAKRIRQARGGCPGRTAMIRFAHSKLAGIVLLALVLRGAVLWRTASMLDDDVDQYRGIALNLIAGRGYAGPGDNLPTAFRPPLYPLLLASVFALGGSSFSAGLVQMLIGAPTVLLTYAAGRRLGLHRGAGLAALLVAIDPLLLHNTSLIMTETLAACLSAGWLYLAAGDDRAANFRRPLAIGVVLGVCCLCRPTYVAVGALTVSSTGMAWLARRLGWSGALQMLPGSSRRSCFAFVLGAGLTLGPWVVRNAVVLGAPIATTTHGGYTLLLGHNPVYYAEVVDRPWGAVWGRDSLVQWQTSLEVELARDRVAPHDELARDRWMYCRAWRTIRSNPAHAIRSSLTLLGRLWNLAPLAGSVPTVARWAIGGFYMAVFAGMLSGLLRMPARECRRWQPALCLIVGFTLVHAVYWADMRMRAPLVPALALLAARGIQNRSSPREAAGTDSETHDA